MTGSIPAKILSTFTAHSNISVICRKYGITRDGIKGCLSQEYIEISDVSVPITTEKNCVDWNNAKRGLSDAVEGKLLYNRGVNDILAVQAFSLRKFSEMLVDEIIEQIKRSYEKQSTFSYLTAGNE